MYADLLLESAIKRYVVRIVLLLALLAQPAHARAPQQPDPARTLDYIHRAWTTLTRSLDDCSALHDVKIAGAPMLYLPADAPRP